MNFTCPEDYHSCRLTCIHFHLPQVTPHPNPFEITIQGFRNNYSLIGGWYNSYQSGVISITLKFVHQYREKLRGVQEEQLQTGNTSLGHS